jgi:hypothetical protein
MLQFHQRQLIRPIDHPTHQLSISILIPTNRNLPISQLLLKINPSLIMQDYLKVLKLMKRLKLLITVNLLFMSSILSQSICQLLGKITSSSLIREALKILSQGRHLKGQVSNNLPGNSLNTSSQSLKPPIHLHTSPNNIPTKTNPLSR